MTKKIKQDTKKEDMLQVMQLLPPKLKDDPPHKSRIKIDCQKQFGFLPEVIIIDKVHGRNNRIMVSAVVPKESKKLKQEGKNEN